MNITMDVTTVSGASAFQQLKLTKDVQSSVAAKVLDSRRTEGTVVIRLLESASAPVGGKGSSLDVQG